MKWLGSGMQARFLLAMGGAMVVVVATEGTRCA